MDELRANAEAALRTLWTMANAEDTAHGERVKLLQWFAELGIGKPATIDRGGRDGYEGGGIVLLPAVLADEAAILQFEESKESEKSAPARGPEGSAALSDGKKKAKKGGAKSERND